MTNYKLFDCQRMFRHACAFAEVADMAMEKFQQNTADIEWYTEPAAVNSAFACEVFLKALLLYHGVTLRKEHKIQKLYELLHNISDAFVDWRYSYETVGSKRDSMQINVGFLTAFRNSLREACCREFFSKTWEEYSAN